MSIDGVGRRLFSLQRESCSGGGVVVHSLTTAQTAIPREPSTICQRNQGIIAAVAISALVGFSCYRLFKKNTTTGQNVDLSQAERFSRAPSTYSLLQSMEASELRSLHRPFSIDSSLHTSRNFQENEELEFFDLPTPPPTPICRVELLRTQSSQAVLSIGAFSLRPSSEGVFLEESPQLDGDFDFCGGPSPDPSPVRVLISSDDFATKMIYKAGKALSVHRRKDPKAPYVKELPPLDPVRTDRSPLSLEYYIEGQQGLRKSMEDAHCFFETDKVAIAGIFDGHGGCTVAEYAKEETEKHFLDLLQNHKGNAFLAFESLFRSIQNNIKENPQWDYEGSTAVVCYVDKIEHRVYTATIGDSEANIYRRNSETKKIESIPLSFVLDWGSKSESFRAALYYKDPKIAETWPMKKKSKDLRVFFPTKRGTTRHVNLSRSLGDVFAQDSEGSPVILAKPEITVHQLQKGDILVLCCDGLKDFVSETDIVLAVERNPRNLARELVSQALGINHSTDNVSVLAIKM